MSHPLVVLLVAAVMAMGLVGTVVPAVPGLGLVWLAGLAYGLSEGFGAVGVIALVSMTALGVAGVAAGVVVPRRAARGAGAARSSLVLGALLAVLGFFVVPVVGLPLGGALGIQLGEQFRTRDLRSAWRTTRATLTGFGRAALIQLAAGIAMVLAWTTWVVAR